MTCQECRQPLNADAVCESCLCAADEMERWARGEGAAFIAAWADMVAPKEEKP